MSDESQIQDEPASREEVAMLEVGHTDISKAVTRFLVIGFLGLIAGVVLIDQGSGLITPSGADESRTLPSALQVVDIIPSASDVSEGATQGTWRSLKQFNAQMLSNIGEFEDTLEDESVVANAIIPTMQDLLIGRLRAGNESAYCGREGWLFYRPGIDYLTGKGFLNPRNLRARSRAGNEVNAPPQPDPRKAIIEFHEQLAARGIQLVIVPAPVKPMIYPEQFSGRYDGKRALQNPSYDEFRKQLEAQGILVCDVSDALMTAKVQAAAPLYLASDTHWSPQGLAVATQAISDFVGEHGLLPGTSAIRYETDAKAVENLGDVANMLNLPEDQTTYKPETVTIQRVSESGGEPWKPHRDSEVLLLGDSFANIYSLDGMGWGENAGLAEQLSLTLQRHLDTITINDAGAHATREQLSRELARGNDRLAGKKLVIWEFAMRELAVGDWKIGLDLALGAPSTTRVDPDEGFRVRGVVSASTQPPRPGSVPYKDCVIALHLTGVEAEEIALDEDEIVVFVWGMRDNQWTSAARFNPGEEIEIDLVPWASVESSYGSYNRMELDDDDTLLLPTYWAAEQDEPNEIEAVQRPAPQRDTQPRNVQSDAIDNADDAAEGFLKNLAVQVSDLEAAGKNTLRGKDDWLFFGPELRSLSAGKFWGDEAKDVSRATNPDYADPLPAILDFHQQLERAGIELLMVPVPAKAVVYPDMIADDVLSEDGQDVQRLDKTQTEFYRLLADNGVNVLDLTSEFIDRRFAPDGPMFCKQDTHWSPAACVLAARIISEQLEGRAWLEDTPNQSYVTETIESEITGDLWKFLGDETLPKEVLPLTRVGLRRENSLQPVAAWRESPVLLLGDSHNLVFQAGGDMHGTGGGLADHLAKELGFPMDLVAVRGSGATPARMNLLRRRDNLAGKKLVIWCFTFREFTESPGGWRILPVIR